MIKLEKILILLFVIIGIVKSGEIQLGCTWWVNFKANGSSCTYTDVCGTILEAFDKLYNTDLISCPNTVDRYINIVSSSLITYNGTNNVPLILKYPQVDEDHTYLVIVQAIDEIVDTSQPPTKLPITPSTTNAIVDAEGRNMLLHAARVSAIQFYGLTFQNGISQTSGTIDAPVIVYGSTKTVTFERCTFKNNKGTLNYGALFWSPNEGGNITNCQFIDNSASNKGHGGAIHLSDINTLTNIVGSTFRNNNAARGGAIYSLRSSIVISDSIFQANQAAESGGALWIQGTSRTVGQSWNRNQFKDNRAAVSGGALYDFSCIISYQVPIFTNNTAGLNGGAITFINSISTVALGTFTGNRAPNGGALWVWDDSPNDNQLLIKESSFTSNIASEMGGAIYCNSSTARMNANNTFTKNLATGNESTGIDFCTKTCLTAARDCGCISGCGLPPPPVTIITDKHETKIAIAIFLPVTAILLGVVGFLLYKTKEKAKLHKPNNLSYDEIRLTPTNMYEKQQDETDQL